MQDNVVGIDLGTTNSLIGTIVEGKIKLFGDASGGELMPSVVGMDEAGAILVGRAARNRRVLDPQGTVVSVKRRMGTEERVRVGKRELTPPQVSALILGALLDRAQAALGARPDRAIITVPAWFNDAQREATRNAGEIAGLRVERLVNEPTAAALTYQTGSEECVLVYDLGGGTFDVSILDRDQDFLEVKASRGDTQLGGDDIDRELCELVLKRIGSARENVDRDPRAMTRLVEAVERAKIALSDREEVRLFDPFLAGEGDRAVHLDLPLTRADVEQVARPLVERTLRCIDEALADAGTKPNALSRVLLVGGSSKMPIVATMVSKHLGMPVQVDAEADRAVALGASMLAGRAAGAEVAEVLVDITPHTLSVGVLDLMDLDYGAPEGEEDLAAAPVVPRDTVVPVERSRTFYTTHENQDEVRVPVVQGEGPRVGDNTWLGHLTVEGLPPSPARSPVEVVFKLDLSGVLHATAKHVPSGRAATVTFADSPYRLTAQKRGAARKEVEELRALVPQAPAPGKASESELSLARSMLQRAERALAASPDAEASIRDRVQAAMKELGEAQSAGSERTQELIDKLSDALLDMT
ncbi:MAG: Hsp70 family protein [Deltaproteobacteria bacterium]|nr:Hsp70 family protein [Deltaproteobacteria bacterium]